MSKRNDGKVDVSYDAGFLVCRLLGVDESTGELEECPGRHARIRARRVEMYTQEAPGILEVHVAGFEEPFEVVGSMPAMDRAMKRDRLFETRADGDD